MDDRSILIRICLRSFWSIKKLFNWLHCLRVNFSVKILIFLNKSFYRWFMRRRILCLDLICKMWFRRNKCFQTITLNSLYCRSCLIFNRVWSLRIDHVKYLIIIWVQKSSKILMVINIFCIYLFLWMSQFFQILIHTWKIRFGITYSKSWRSFDRPFFLINSMKIIRINFNFFSIFIKFRTKFWAWQWSASRALSSLCSLWNLDLFVWFMNSCLLFKWN